MGTFILITLGVLWVASSFWSWVMRDQEYPRQNDAELKSDLHKVVDDL